MEFIDHTGHVFSLPSYDVFPIGYEYNEEQYIFWFDTEYGYKLSVDNYYFKPIRVLVPLMNNQNMDNIRISINVDPNSQFKLVSSSLIQDMVDELKSINEPIRFSKEKFVSELVYDESHTDLHIVNDIVETIGKTYRIPYYTYEVNGNEMTYNGTIEEEDGKLIGTIKFGIFNETVELTQKWNTYRYAENDNADTVTIDGVEYPLEATEQQYMLVPFYAVFCTSEAATWETNVMINVSLDSNETNEYCPITLGANVVDECEELIINGQNVGIKLPKEILNAVYQCRFGNDVVDEKMYKDKLKEYLMNFMEIKGQQGNFRSALSSLKWFGWGDKVTVNKLWKTDIQLTNHYIRDYFDIINDTLYSFKWFKNTSLISLSLRANEEIDVETHNFDNELYGEAKPIYGDLFEKVIVQHYDEGDIDFYRGYFDYTFDELALKLCALKYFYSKYFLPIHIKVNNASVEYQCHANDIKWVVKPSVFITENPIFINTEMASEISFVEFPKTDIVMLEHQVHYIDSNYNEFRNSQELGDNDIEDIYFVDDTCASVAIKFRTNDKERYFDCVLMLLKDGENIHTSKFQFVQNPEDPGTEYLNFVIHPKTINTIVTGVKQKYDINYWIDSNYQINLYVNGIWHTYKFRLVLPELNIQLGHLEYQYDTENDLFRQVSSIDEDKISFNAYMHNPELAMINNMDFIDDIMKYMNNENTVHISNRKTKVGSIYYYLEHNGKRYVFSSMSDTLIVSEDNGETFEESNEDIVIERSGNRYSIRDGEEYAENLILKSSLYENMSYYIKKYYTVPNVFVDNKYLNRCHLVNILDENGNMIPYIPNESTKTEIEIDGAVYAFDDNTSEDAMQLYKDFFDNNGISVFEKTDGKYVPANKIGNMYYDFYLMHDYNVWYGLFISRDVITNFSESQLKFNVKSKNSLTVEDDSVTATSETINPKYFLKINASSTYYMEYVGSSNNIIINRLKYIPANGNNHFSSTDIIVMELTNNNRLCFKLGLGSKWHIKPLSIGMVEESEVKSPNEMAIVSIGNGNLKYSRGYYDVECNYSIDDYIQHSYTKRAKFRVD